MRIGQFNILVENGLISDVRNTPGSIHIISDGFDLQLDNAWLYPGFVDSHGHLFALGNKLNTLDLSDCKSPSDCIEKAKTHIAKRENWLTGRGWNQENWDNKSFPEKNILDKFFYDIPVYFTRIDGHAAWVNSRALELTGIDNSTQDPYGGKIIRNEAGEPTGILLDNAMSLVHRFIPSYDDLTKEKFILNAVDELLRYGIIAVHDMDVSPDLIPLFKRLDDDGKLKIKVYAYLQAQNDEWLYAGHKPYKGRNFHITGVKFYADGALGSRGAALFEPYSDDNTTNGLLLIDRNALYSKAKVAIEAGFGIATHAIGDAANDLVLRVYAKLRENGVADKNTVLRIEHAQMIRPEDIEYFKKYNIFASVQPIHCLSDAPMAQKRIGDRVKYSYPWASLLDAGVLLASGSDFPIESHNPFLGIDALVNRIPFNQEQSWFPEESLPVDYALDCYTVNSKNLIGESLKTGEIKVGNPADFVVLDKNLSALNHDEFTNVNVLATFVNGKSVYVNPSVNKSTL